MVCKLAAPTRDSKVSKVAVKLERTLYEGQVKDRSNKLLKYGNYIYVYYLWSVSGKVVTHAQEP